MPTPAVQNALDSAPAVAGFEMSFADFTTKLIRDTMNALVQSALSQMRAFADLVSTVERGLTAFTATVNPPSGGGILAWIQSNLPDLTVNPDGTVTWPTTNPKWGPSSVSALEKLFVRAVQASQASSLLLGATAKAPVDQTLIGAPISADEIGIASGTKISGTPTPLTPTSTTATILDAINAMLNDEAQTAYQELNTLLKMGLYRVVVTDGHILTRATFNMVTTDASQQSASDTASSSFSLAASVGGGFPFLSGSLKTSYSDIHIKLANSSSSTSTTITENVTGEVLVNFKGDYFPVQNVPTKA